MCHDVQGDIVTERQLRASMVGAFWVRCTRRNVDVFMCCIQHYQNSALSFLTKKYGNIPFTKLELRATAVTDHCKLQFTIVTDECASYSPMVAIIYFLLLKFQKSQNVGSYLEEKKKALF